MAEPTRQRLAPSASEPTFRLRLIPGGADAVLSAEEPAAPPTRCLEAGPPASPPVLAPPQALRPPRPPAAAAPPAPSPPAVRQRPSSDNLRLALPPPPCPRGAVTLTEELAAVVPFALAHEHHCFPFHREGGWLWIATDRADRDVVAEAVAARTGLSTVVGEAPMEAVEVALSALYGGLRRDPLRLLIEPLREAEEAPTSAAMSDAWAGFDFSAGVRNRMGDILALTSQVVREAGGLGEEPDAPDPGGHAARLVDELLGLALEVEASDVHIEPDDGRVRVRMRLDGVLQPLVELPMRVLPRVVGRLKVLSSLNLVEKRLPQEARFRYLQSGGRRVDIRVSTMPVVHGEGVVLRLLDTAHLRGRVEDLGLEGDDLGRVRRCLRGPRGLVLATGPTGSGKSTTLYTLATELNEGSRKIVTVEDPVEYHLEGLQQVQVQAGIGLTFERVIRSCLRQDPDVLLVGEIRDAETAQAAVKAALTGHLVLSSLHTADAAGAVARLLDLGVDRSACAAALRLVMGQRLLRTLCRNCARPLRPGMAYDLLDMAGLDPTLAEMSLEAVGCLECRSVGYQGRRAIFEVMDCHSPRLRRLIQGGAAAEVLQAAAVEEGMTSLGDAALRLVRDGETSVEEALRVVWLD